MPDFRILFCGPPNLISQSNELSGRKVPKLLESYNICSIEESINMMVMMAINEQKEVLNFQSNFGPRPQRKFACSANFVV